MSFRRVKFSRAKRIEIRRELGKQFIDSFVSSLCHFPLGDLAQDLTQLLPVESSVM